MKNLIFVFVFIFIGCSSSKQILKEGGNSYGDIIKVSVLKSDNDKILFRIFNNSDSIVYIYNPQNIHIERFEDAVWAKISILNCPCGAPCAKPDGKVEILKDKHYELFWDKNESWCGKRNVEGFQETKKEPAKTGKYRIRIISSISNEKKNVFYEEFTLN